MNHFTAAFEKTKRLGFKAKMECAACLRAKPRDVFDKMMPRCPKTRFLQPNYLLPMR